MTEARALLLEESAGRTVLAGRWPDLALIDPLDIPEMCPAGLRPSRIGDDFVIELPNARATYRYVGDDGRNMICFKIK